VEPGLPSGRSSGQYAAAEKPGARVRLPLRTPATRARRPRPAPRCHDERCNACARTPLFREPVALCVRSVPMCIGIGVPEPPDGDTANVQFAQHRVRGRAQRNRPLFRRRTERDPPAAGTAPSEGNIRRQRAAGASPGISFGTPQPFFPAPPTPIPGDAPPTGWADRLRRNGVESS